MPATIISIDYRWKQECQEGLIVLSDVILWKIVDLKIKFDKNTIDHLGIKLYSSFPPVIAELISNSYDADAENVEIKINYDEKV